MNLQKSIKKKRIRNQRYRTNEEFLKTDIHSTNRANLEEYNFINQISVNNTNYKNNKIFKKIS